MFWHRFDFGTLRCVLELNVKSPTEKNIINEELEERDMFKKYLELHLQIVPDIILKIVKKNMDFSMWSMTTT